MRTYDPAVLTYLANRGGFVARTLVWVVAKNRATGVPEEMGLWNGAQEQAFTIGGEARTYHGAGTLIGVPPITAQVGLDVRMHRLALAGVTPEVAQLIRGYDPRLAPVEIHQALFNPESRALIAEPHRVFKGYIDELTLTVGEEGGEGSCEVVVASSARNLTRTLPLHRSDEVQKRRGGDRFRRWVDVSGSVDVWWGEGNSAAPAKPAFTGLPRPPGLEGGSLL